MVEHRNRSHFRLGLDLEAALGAPREVSAGQGCPMGKLKLKSSSKGAKWISREVPVWLLYLAARFPPCALSAASSVAGTETETET